MKEDQLKVVAFLLLGLFTIFALWSKNELVTKEKTAGVPTFTHVSSR